MCCQTTRLRTTLTWKKATNTSFMLEFNIIYRTCLSSVGGIKQKIESIETYQHSWSGQRKTDWHRWVRLCAWLALDVWEVEVNCCWLTTDCDPRLNTTHERSYTSSGYLWQWNFYLLDHYIQSSIHKFYLQIYRRFLLLAWQSQICRPYH